MKGITDKEAMLAFTKRESLRWIAEQVIGVCKDAIMTKSKGVIGNYGFLGNRDLQNHGNSRKCRMEENYSLISTNYFIVHFKSTCTPY